MYTLLLFIDSLIIVSRTFRIHQKYLYYIILSLEKFMLSLYSHEFMILMTLIFIV